MGYQPRTASQIASQINTLHLVFNIIVCTIISAVVIIPLLFLRDPFGSVWALSTISVAFPTIWIANDYCKDLAFKIGYRHIDKEMEHQKAKVAKNKMIRESEEFILACRKSK